CLDGDPCPTKVKLSFDLEFKTQITMFDTLASVHPGAEPACLAATTVAVTNCSQQLALVEIVPILNFISIPQRRSILPTLQGLHYRSYCVRATRTIIAKRTTATSPTHVLTSHQIFEGVTPILRQIEVHDSVVVEIQTHWSASKHLGMRRC